MRRGIAATSVLLMVLGAGLWQAKSAVADPVPWTWVEASASGTSSPSGTTLTATCPVGYRAVSGGLTDTDAGYVSHITFAGRSYSVLVYETSGNDLTVTAWCALSDEVDVTVVSKTLTTSHQQGDFDYGLGDFACDGDATPLGASLTWSSGGYHVTQTGPETIDGVNEWFVAAASTSTWSPLSVDLLCVPTSDLTGASWVTQATKNTSGDDHTETAVSSCPAQQRMITGGEHVDSLFAQLITSTPTDRQTWSATAEVPAGDTLTSSVLCVPDGDPVASFLTTPARSINVTAATFTFDAVDPAGGTAQNACFLNTTYLGLCNGSYTVTDLTEGSNVFSIEAVADDGRGWAPTEKDYYFWVDRTPPTVTTTAPPRFTLGDSATLHAVGHDNQDVDHYTFAVTSSRATGPGASSAGSITTTYDSTTGDVTFPVTPGTSYRASVTDYDSAGNASVETNAYVLTAAPLDNLALSASRHWALIKGKAYTHGLVSRTRTHGATLRTTMYGDDLGIVATTCQTCGTIGVYVGKVLVKRVDLHAATTHHQRVVKIPVNGNPITMKVVLRVLSHHQLVEIDGLGAVVN